MMENMIEISKTDASFILEVLNQDWVNCCMKLNKNDLGDIERAQIVETGKRDMEIMRKLFANGIH